MAQNNSSGPTWYDILGITPDATPDAVKAAWRDATDKFEPGTGAGQFRLFNEAADVLLDPAKRAEYDAGLGLAADAPVVDEPAAPVDLAKPSAAGEPSEPFDPFETVAAQPPAEPTVAAQPPGGPGQEDGAYPIGVRLVAVLAVLAVMALVVAGVFAIRLEN
ncbi:MAG: J domain-containing protein, partial [Marmoricola sp.]